MKEGNKNHEKNSFLQLVLLDNDSIKEDENYKMYSHSLSHIHGDSETTDHSGSCLFYR